MRVLAGYTQTQAIERLGDFLEISDSTLSRLESLAEAPTDPRRRRKAWALAVSYGFDPAEIGLTEADQPPLVVVNGMRDQGFAMSRCTRTLQLTLRLGDGDPFHPEADRRVHALAS